MRVFISGPMTGYAGFNRATGDSTMITFTKKQLATLRKIAQRATQGEWVAFISPGTDTYAVHTPGDERCGDIIKWPGFDDQKNAENNAEFIAAFNPEVVQALLDELEAAKSKLNEQREYYEGVIAVGSTRITELSENRLAGSPTIPDEVLSAIRKVARMRVDSVTFDGDKRGLINALDEAEDALILTVSEYADEIAAAEIKD